MQARALSRPSSEPSVETFIANQPGHKDTYGELDANIVDVDGKIQIIMLI